MKQSKNTQALLAVYPTLRDWLLATLTLAQLYTVLHSPNGFVSFGPNHPLNDETYVAGVFRAYREEAIWCIKSQFGSLEHFDDMRGQGETFNAFYHHALITAIAFMVDEDPSVRKALMKQEEPSGRGGT